jgi:hypothetical protein
MNIPKHPHPPDKGEVGGSSPPRPTIQITSEYAAIFTFPIGMDFPRKTDLPKTCQKSDRGARSLSKAFRSLQTSFAAGISGASANRRESGRRDGTRRNILSVFASVSNSPAVSHVRAPGEHSVNSLVPDLITIVPEPRQIEGNQHFLIKWG